MMETQANLVQWLLKMGYDGQISDSLPNICNNSTSFIWDQLINNVKPRQEVDYIRRNILVNRLKTDKNEFFNCPIKEIEIYEKKKNLEKKLRLLQEECNEKEVQVNNSVRQNNMKYLIIENIKDKIKEDEEKIFLLEAKSKMFETDIKDVEETLELAKNLTPVEDDDNLNSNTITETLQKCAEKLENLTKKVPTDNFNKTATTLFSTRKKMNFTKSSFFDDNKENRNINSCKNDSFGLLPDYLNISDNLLYNSKINNQTCSKQVFSNLNQTLQTNSLSFLIEKTSQDNFINKTLSELLHTNNRELIKNNWMVIYNKLLEDMKKTIVDYVGNERNGNSGQTDMKKLHFIHIRNELEILKQKKIINRLKETVKEHQKHIFTVLASKSINKSRLEEISEIFSLQIEEIQLETSLNKLKQELNSSEELETSNLHTVLTKTKKNQNEIDLKLNAVQDFAKNICKIIEIINNIPEEIFSHITRLNSFISDENWIEPLLIKDLFLNEIKLFQNFPLEFNRKFKNSVNYRDLTTKLIPCNFETDCNFLSMISTIIDCPCTSIEEIFFRIIDLKRTLSRLENLKINFDFDYKNCDLNLNEAYVKDVKMLENVKFWDNMKNLIDLWMEMPFNVGISNRRLINGFDYKYYERKFDCFYGGL